MTDRDTFVASVLERYRAAPDTPGRAGPADRRLAGALFDRGVALEVVAAAVLLVTLRRHCRAPDLPPLEPIRSLHYFQPVITEILRHPLEPAYLEYLADKIQRIGLALTPSEPPNERPGRP